MFSYDTRDLLGNRQYSSSVYVPKLPMAVRFEVLILVLGCFVAHIAEVWLYAGAVMAIYNRGALHRVSTFLRHPIPQWGSGVSIRPPSRVCFVQAEGQFGLGCRA